MFKGFDEEIKKGLPAPAYFLWGKNPPLLEKLIQKAVESVIGQNPKEFNYHVFEKSSSLADILNTIMTLPFLTARRLVVLKDFHEFPASQTKKIKSYLENPNETTCMIITSEKKPDDQKKKLKWKPFYLGLKEKDITFWLKEKALESGFQLTDKAAHYLIELTGPDMGLLPMELEKLSLFGKKTINTHDVESLSASMREYSVFNLVDAVMEKQKDKAFKILKNLLIAKGTPPHLISGTIVWQYEQFYFLWENKGRRPSKMNLKTYRILSSYLRRCSEDYFFRIFSVLHEADIRIKSSGRPEIALEMLLLNLLQVPL